MTQDVNPYAAPSGGASIEQRREFIAHRIGHNLVVEKNAALPDVCVKCGSDDVAERRKQDFAFTPQWVMMLVVISPLIAGIAMLITQKRGTLHLPLCSDCAYRWRRAVSRVRMAALWMVAAIVIALVCAANDEGFLAVIFGISSIVPLIVVGVNNRKWTMKSIKVDQSTITLADVHPAAIEAILESSRLAEERA